jgi:formate dehydrogenase subunit beta
LARNPWTAGDRAEKRANEPTGNRLTDNRRKNMPTTAKIDVQNNNILAAIQNFTRSILELEEFAAVLAPCHLPGKAMVMPVLVSDPEQLEGLDPLAPAFALNAAKMVSRLTRKPMGEKIAVMLRPCEIRAFVELIKLKQASRQDVFIIGTDCLGAFTNKDYLIYAQAAAEQATVSFCQSALTNKALPVEGIDLAGACKVCEHPLPDGADVAIGLLGVDTADRLLIQSQSPAGDGVIQRLELGTAPLPEQRAAAVQALLAGRLAGRDQMAAATSEATDSLEKLGVYLANCVNCYNCRVACPVCYCRECVFLTDAFDYEPLQYLGWARRKGAIKMPTDTVFYHLTRMVHMSTACVGCGQCSNACPNEVPVMELFRTVALRTQAAFGYEAGKDASDRPPLSEFREEEFEEVVGIG